MMKSCAKNREVKCR